MSRYAHYVLIRTQCFGGMFDEIGGSPPKDKKKSPPKPITSTNLRQENLDAAKLLLNAGIACVLKDGEECENTALATERVASDLISLTGAVAKALNKALKNDDLEGADPALLQKWCEFYSEELAPKTRAMVKKTAPKLDAFSLFLPSRASDTVSPDLLQKGLKLGETEVTKTEGGDEGTLEEEEPSTKEAGSVEEPPAEASDKEAVSKKEEEGEDDAVDEEEDLGEYEYEEDEEYYDDEDEL